MKFVDGLDNTLIRKELLRDGKYVTLNSIKNNYGFIYVVVLKDNSYSDITRLAFISERDATVQYESLLEDLK